jgi:hypothetical protein
MNATEKQTQLLENFFYACKQSLFHHKANAVQIFLSEQNIDYCTLDAGYLTVKNYRNFRTQFIESKPTDFDLDNTFSFGGWPSRDKVAPNPIVFPLRDKYGEIINLLAYRPRQTVKSEIYLIRKNEGIYPCYPNTKVKRLFIFDRCISAAHWMQHKFQSFETGVMTFPNGQPTATCISAILELDSLEEIVVMYVPNNWAWMRKIVSQMPYCKFFTEQQFLQHQEVEMLDLISSEKGKLTPCNHQKLLFIGEEARYEIVGKMDTDLSQLRVSMRIIHHHTLRLIRTKLDLFEWDNVLKQLSEFPMEMDKNIMEKDLIALTVAIEKYKEKCYLEDTYFNDNTRKIELTATAQNEALRILERKSLLPTLSDLLEQAGIVGEHHTKLSLFIIASSYKMHRSLHGILQGNSGAGKTHLLTMVAQAMPTEDVVYFTQITAKSFYHYTNQELVNKLLVFHDLEGVSDGALFALRELQTNGELIQSTTGMHKHNGRGQQLVKVSANFASLAATTSATIYPDNASRSLIFGLDESDDQTKRIISHQNKLNNGSIDPNAIETARVLLRNCMRLLAPCEVVNPFANKLRWPIEITLDRRMNEHFQLFVGQIAWLHQFSRLKDEGNRIVVEKEDLKMAITLFCENVFIKKDALDPMSRILFEQLKKYLVQRNSGDLNFTQREIKTALSWRKTKTAALVKLWLTEDKIEIVGGAINKGWIYTLLENTISNVEMKDEIVKNLHRQIDSL